jgi:hypothetical protein
MLSYCILEESKAIPIKGIQKYPRTDKRIVKEVMNPKVRNKILDKTSR